MEILAVIAYLVVFLYLIGRWEAFRLPGLPRRTAAVLFLLKFGAGLALAYIYTEYYTDRASADVFKLFDDSRYMYEAIHSKPEDYFRMITGLDHNAPYYDRYYFRMNNWYRPYDVDYNVYHDTRTLIRLNAFVRLFSFGIYGIHVLVWCFLSLIGLCLIYKTFYRYAADRPWWLASGIFLLPSVLCWGSGVLKEGIVFLLLGILVYCAFRWLMIGFKLRYIIYLLIAFAGFNLLKVHVLLSLIPAFIALVICRFTAFRHIRLTFVLVTGIITLLALNIQHLFPAIHFMEVISLKQQAMLRLAYYTGSGSTVDMQPLEPTFWSFLRNWPEALINAALRPSVLDATTSIQWLSAFENFFIGVCMILCVGLYVPVKDGEKRAVVWFCLCFTLVLYTIMGLATPILGTLVRYRMPALPFLFTAMVLLTDVNRLARIFREATGMKQPEDF